MKFCGLGMEANGQALAFSLNIIFTKIPLIPDRWKNHVITRRRATAVGGNQVRIPFVFSEALEFHPDLIWKFFSHFFVHFIALQFSLICEAIKSIEPYDYVIEDFDLQHVTRLL